MEVIPSRDLNLLYILLDIGFLLILAGALLWCRKYLAALFGLFGGLLYFLVDYGGFYLLLGTREVSGADPFWFLLWLSMSYGFTNFVWIWLWLDRDGHALEWSVLIVAGWLAVALLAALPGVVVNSRKGAESAPQIVSASFQGVRSEVLLHALEDKGIYVSSGSACSSNHPAISGTLKAIGVRKELLDSTLRFSFGMFNTKEEIDYCMEVLEELLPVLRRYHRG